MVPPAQNALLKTLEEPPSASVFVLVSSVPDALLPTVLSRCQRLRFGALSAAEVAEALMRDHEYEEPKRARRPPTPMAASAARSSAESADMAEAREMAHAAARAGARGCPIPAGGSSWRREVTSRRRRAAGVEREQLAACLRALASLLRDIGLLARRATRACWRTPISRRGSTRSRAPTTATAAVRAYAAVDQALAALERNASPKVVADWLVLQRASR